MSIIYIKKSLNFTKTGNGIQKFGFGLNTERYSVSLRVQPECWKIQTRITPNTDTSYTVKVYVQDGN